MGLITLLLVAVTVAILRAQSVDKVSLGFPEAWDGDKYKELYCPSKSIPKFLGKLIEFILTNRIDCC